MTSPPPIAPDTERLLIICPSWVGDAVMATPLLRAARTRLPGARIIGLMRPGIDELLAGLPSFDERIATDLRGLLGPARVAREIRRRCPQAALLLPNSFRSALCLWLSGTPTRVGYDRDGRGRLLTHRHPVVRADRPTPLLDYYASLATFALGAAEIDPRPELAVTEAEATEAERLLHDVDGPFVLLIPGANKPPKRWPPQRFAAVADELARSHGLRAVVTGSPREIKALDAVVAAAKGPIANLARRGLTLGSLKAVSRRAALVITNDTGPRHVAAALGTPLVSLFGPTDHRWTTFDCPHESVVLANPFLPEDRVADELPEACAIDRITVADVVASARQRLAGSLGQQLVEGT